MARSALSEHARRREAVRRRRRFLPLARGMGGRRRHLSVGYDENKGRERQESENEPRVWVQPAALLVLIQRKARRGVRFR
jgi:hypothetical protein